MTVKNSALKSDIQNSFKLSIGTVYFFENYLLTEMDEGANVDLINGQELIYAIREHFSDGRPYGMICNRINSFSINLLDLEKLHNAANGLVARAIVTYSNQSEKAIELENHFCSFPNKKQFKSLLSAEKWVQEQLNLFKLTNKIPRLNKFHQA